MVLILPLEIVKHVADYLSQKDFYQLILVNHAFYRKFITFLHEDIKLSKSKQFHQLTVSPQYHSYVKHLDVGQVILSVKYLEKIRQLFPTLCSISVNLHCHPNAEMFLRSFQNLESLSIGSLPGTLPLLDILAAVPQLKKLSTTYDDRLMITDSLLDSIHTLCPFLESLSIEGKKAEVLVDGSDATIQQYPRMKELSISCKTGLNNCHPWLLFVSNRYPNIISLRFQHYINYRKDRASGELMDQSSAAFCKRFISKCPRLTHFEWSNVLPVQALMRQPDQHQQQFHVLDLCNEQLVYSFKNACLANPSDFLAISKLSLTLSREMECDSTIMAIGKVCPQLKQLELRGRYMESMPEIHMETILQHCRYLVELKLYHFQILTNPIQALQQPYHTLSHPLKVMDLHTCTVTGTFFDHVSLCCQDLTDLTLTHIKFAHPYLISKVFLPRQRLQKLDIQSYLLSELCTIIPYIQQYQNTKPINSLTRRNSCPSLRSINASSSLATIANSKNCHISNTLPNQHLSPWLNLAESSLSRQLDLLKNIDLLQTLADRRVMIVCESIQTLCINNIKVF